MNKKFWPIISLVFLVLIPFAAGCDVESDIPVMESGSTQAPEVVTVVVTVLVEAESEATAVPPATHTPAAIEPPADAATAEPAAATASGADEPETPGAGEVVAMSLKAQKPKTEHSPCAADASFVEPATLDDLSAPSEQSWRVLETGEVTEFHSYDGIRVTEDGEALLDLGNLMRLLLKCDTVTQIISESLAVEKLNKIQVDFEDTPLLQQIVLAMHLSRGGFLGEKSIDSGPIALTTPNAVIIVSGTTFFLVYDPEAETTWVGNFEGTVDVADVELQEGEGLPDQQLIAIPPVRNRKFWPIHEHMTPEEFSHLIDVLGSPSAAANLISGPYLVGNYEPVVAVRNGPGTEYALVGTLARHEYARVVGRGLGWWQIACPQNTKTRGTDCWVSGGSAYTDAYNIDDVALSVIPEPPASEGDPGITYEETPVSDPVPQEDPPARDDPEKPSDDPTPADPPDNPPSPMNTPAAPDPYPG